MRLIPALSWLVVACALVPAASIGSQANADPAPKPAPPAAAKPVPAKTAPPAAQPAPPAAAKPAPPAPAAKWKPVDTNPQPGVGQDFLTDGMTLYRVLSCGGDAPVPKGLDATVVETHCKRLLAIMQRYRDGFLVKATALFNEIRPKALPQAVVYPFGGGDLLTALTTFPDALEFTTISLEHAGDPQRIGKLTKKTDLEKALQMFDDSMSTLLSGDWNWTRNFEAMEQLGIPDQLGSALMALVIHGYEPVSVRFFSVKRDGSLDYFDAAKLAAAKATKPDKLRPWGAPDWSNAFSNVEVRFRSRTAGGPIKVYRHVAANVSDAHLTTDPNHLTKNPGLLMHLQAKGPVAAMTRAASHLLWEPAFSQIRDYLTANLVWMPSDSTGVPPPFAKAAGLVQDTYGTFDAAYEASDQGHRPQYNEAFKELFAKNPKKPLEFRYGYPDVNKKAHMVVTRRVK
jgi:hypothetical protein